MTAKSLTSNVRTTGGKFLTFNLAAEIYGVEVGFVREIAGMTPITAVPNTPKFIKGVMNLRGKIVPVIDLRIKFGMESCSYSRETCVVVVEIRGSQGKILMGVIVDSVREVIDVVLDEIGEVPSFGIRVNTDFLKGLANVKSGLTLLLDIEHVLSHEEMTVVEAAPDTAVMGEDSVLQLASAPDATKHSDSDVNGGGQ